MFLKVIGEFMNTTTSSHSAPDQRGNSQTDAPSMGSTATIFDQITDTEAHQFDLSHPKNYIGVPLAIASDEPVEIAVPQNLVKMAGEAAYGAEALGLITRDKQLTTAGESVVENLTETQTVQTAFNEIADSTRSRLIDAIQSPTAVQQPIARYPPSAAIIQILSTEGELTLEELTIHALQNNYKILIAYLLSTAPTTFKAFSDDSSKSTTDNRTQTTVEDYTATATYQFKSILFHTGILTTPGSDTTSLDPHNDIWALSPHLDAQLQKTAISADFGGGWQ